MTPEKKLDGRWLMLRAVMVLAAGAVLWWLSSWGEPVRPTSAPSGVPADEVERAQRLIRLVGTEKILQHLGMLDAGLKDPSLRVRLAAVEKLAETPTPEATELLKRALKDEAQSVSGRAYRALRDRKIEVPPPFPGAEFIGHTGEIPKEILEDLKDPDLTIRQNAIVALKGYATPLQAGEHLARALEDPEIKIRFLAVDEVGRLPPAVARPLLEKAMKDGDPRVSSRAKALLESPAPASP